MSDNPVLDGLSAAALPLAAYGVVRPCRAHFEIDPDVWESLTPAERERAERFLEEQAGRLTGSARLAARKRSGAVSERLAPGSQR